MNDIERGIQAKALIESPLFQEAIQKVQQGIFDDFAAVDPSDTDGMRIHRLRLKCLAEITRQLQTVAYTGQLAIEEQQSRIKQETWLKQRMERGIRAVRSIF